MKFQRPTEELAPRPSAIETIAGVEQAPSTAKFDPKVAVPQELWQLMLEKEEPGEIGQGVDFHFALMFPEDRDKLKKDPKIAEVIEKSVSVAIKFNNHGIISQLAKLVVLLPDRAAGIRSDGSLWEKVQQLFRKHFHTMPLFAAVNMAIIFPDQVSELNLSDDDWQREKQKLDQAKEKGHWIDYARAAASMVALFPERRDELELNYNVWQAFYEALGNEAGFALEFDPPEVYNYSRVALYLSMLSAESIEFNSSGMVMKQPGQNIDGVVDLPGRSIIAQK